MNQTDAAEQNGTQEPEWDPCYAYHMPLLNVQFWMVTVVGSSIAGVSILGNCILLYLFMTRMFFRRTYFFYFSILACFDLFHSLAYVAVMSTVVYFEYAHDLVVMRVWYRYVVPTMAVADVIRTASVYILVAACIERYLYAHDLGGFCSNRRRTIALVGFTLFSVIIRGTVFFEMDVLDRRPNCTGLSEFFLVQTELTENWYYKTIWMFWTRNILGTFFPFIALTAFNIAVVLQDRCSCLKVQHDHNSGAKIVKLEYHRIGARRGAYGDVHAPEEIEKGGLLGELKSVSAKTQHWISKAKERVRKAATRTLIVIVFEYLLCNGIGTLLAVWEQFSYSSISQFVYFHALASDFVSLLSVVSCAIRLPTYWLCDVTFRKELAWVFCGSIRARRRRRKKGMEKPSMSTVVASLMNAKEGGKIASASSSSNGSSIKVARTEASSGLPKQASLDAMEQLLYNQADLDEYCSRLNLKRKRYSSASFNGEKRDPRGRWRRLRRATTGEEEAESVIEVPCPSNFHPSFADIL